LPSFFVPHGSRLNCASKGRVDTKPQPGQNTVCDIVAEQNVLKEGVCCGCLLAENRVIGVSGQRLFVVRVRRHCLDEVDEVHVKEALADMGRLVAPDSAIGMDRRVEVYHEVDVDGPSQVVSGEYAVKLRHSIFIGRLYAALERVVEITEISHAGTVGDGIGAAVHTGGIGT
jgi:hypothetical protein